MYLRDSSFTSYRNLPGFTWYYVKLNEVKKTSINSNSFSYCIFVALYTPPRPHCILGGKRCFLRSSGLLVFLFSLAWLPGASLVWLPVADCLPESQAWDVPSPRSTPRWLSQVVHLLLHRVNQSWSLRRVQWEVGGVKEGQKGSGRQSSNQAKSKGIGPQ